MREFVKLAISQAQQQSRISEDTYFSRIASSKGDFDPFDGELVYPFVLIILFEIWAENSLENGLFWLICRTLFWCIWPLWY
jgi:hypothetical protein